MDDKDLLDLEPEGFKFKPAHGKVENDGTVTISGMNIAAPKIDAASVLFDLEDVFKEIDLAIEDSLL